MEEKDNSLLLNQEPRKVNRKLSFKDFFLVGTKTCIEVIYILI